MLSKIKKQNESAIKHYLTNLKKKFEDKKINWNIAYEEREFESRKRIMET